MRSAVSFFTEWGAIIFAAYIEAYEYAKPRIKKIENG